ncbi:MAG: Yip1 family protein [Ferruginibacter sp.]
MVERIKNILLSPKSEWLKIDAETTNPQQLLMSYVLPLAAIGAIGYVIQGLLFPIDAVLNSFLMQAIVSLLATTISYYISAYIIDMLAPTFKSEKDLGKSAQLVGYSRTPSFIAALLTFIPVIGSMLGIAGMVYGVYLMYLGLEPLKKTPEDQKVVYLIVAFLVIITLYMFIAFILGAILLSSFAVTSSVGMFN